MDLTTIPWNILSHELDYHLQNSTGPQPPQITYPVRLLGNSLRMIGVHRALSIQLDFDLEGEEWELSERLQ